VVTEPEAEHLQQLIAALGDFARVDVRALRGHLHIYAGDGEAVARATPLGGGHFGLSFRSHTGRWERLPFAGSIEQIAQDLVRALAPYLEVGSSDRNGGADH
jgi:hypothetical protein